MPRKAYYIATKVGRYELDITKRFDYSREKTIWSVDNSLKKLGMDSVDLIQVSQHYQVRERKHINEIKMKSVL